MNILGHHNHPDRGAITITFDLDTKRFTWLATADHATPILESPILAIVRGSRDDGKQFEFYEADIDTAIRHATFLKGEGCSTVTIQVIDLENPRDIDVEMRDGFLYFETGKMFVEHGVA